MRTHREIELELKRLRRALSFKTRWNEKAREQIEGQVEVLEKRMEPEEVELLWYVDESAEEYRDGDNELWIELDAAARWLAGEKGYEAPSEGLPPAPSTTISRPSKLSAFLFMPVQAVTALWAFILAVFNAGPAVEPQAHQVATAMASVAVPAVLAVTGSASCDTDDDDDEENAFDFVEPAWRMDQDQEPTKVVAFNQRTSRPGSRCRHHRRANVVQRLADKTVNPALRGLRRSVIHLVSR